MRFTIFGEDHDITKEKVIKAVEGKAPELIDRRHKFFVSLEGRRYPIKQLLARAIDRSNSEFTAQYAQRILRKLGFSVEEFGPPPQFKSMKDLDIALQNRDVGWPPTCDKSDDERHRIASVAPGPSEYFEGWTYQGVCGLCGELVDTGDPYDR